jgi:hypothetical protein
MEYLQELMDAATPVDLREPAALPPQRRLFSAKEILQKELDDSLLALSDVSLKTLVTYVPLMVVVSRVQFPICDSRFEKYGASKEAIEAIMSRIQGLAQKDFDEGGVAFLYTRGWASRVVTIDERGDYICYCSRFPSFTPYLIGNAKDESEPHLRGVLKELGYLP